MLKLLIIQESAAKILSLLDTNTRVFKIYPEKS